MHIRSASPRRAARRALVSRIVLGLAGLAASVRAAVPYDFPAISTASPNYAALYNDVQDGVTTIPTDGFKLGTEVRSAAYAYLHPQSPYRNNPAYRDRLLLLLNDRLTAWNAGTDLASIEDAWQVAYAYMLLKNYKPGDITAANKTVWEAGLVKNADKILADSPLLYDQQIQAQEWFNGDIRLAMSVYFTGITLGNTTYRDKAASLINNLLPKSVLGDGGIHYVGFNNEVPTYHDENLQEMIWWWQITGSTQMKAAIDKTREYTVMQMEPGGFGEQSTSIPYKHLYNGISGQASALWHAYLSNDGYNYYYGKAKETTSSTDLINAILYQPGRATKTPSDNFGVVYDDNVLGPRGRFNGTWSWVANGRNVQIPGPGETDQGYDGRMCGKNTFIGAYCLGSVANNTPLKAALDNIAPEVKESAGTDEDYQRGSRYRFLTQDEKTRVITRRNFGTISSTYNVSRRTSSGATADWGTPAPWKGQQLWVLTGERAIGLVQIVSTAATTIYGLDTRVDLVGGRAPGMGAYYDLSVTTLADGAAQFAFNELRMKFHQRTFDGGIAQLRHSIAYNPAQNTANDDRSVLARVNDSAAPVDTATVVPSGYRKWLLVDACRVGTAYATSVNNVLKENNTWAVLEFAESTRKVRIIQNLTGATATYTGNMNLNAAWTRTSVHRSWRGLVDAETVTNNVASISESIPAYGHAIVVNSNENDDHTNGADTYQSVFP